MTWRPTSSGRTLVGRYESLKDADRAIPFVDQQGRPTTEPPPLNWVKQRNAPLPNQDG